MRAVFDSNIVIDLLKGIPEARDEFLAWDEPCLSVVAWIEVLSGAPDYKRLTTWRAFLAQFSLVPISQPIAERAVTLRRLRTQKLPDSVIMATAQELGCVLLTRNTRDFDTSDPSIRVPYTL